MKTCFDTSTMPAPAYPCPVCHSPGAQPVCWVESESAEKLFPTLYAYRCQACASIYYDGEDPVMGYENRSIFPNYWLHYVQAGAGITAMLEPLFALGEPRNLSLLDVGCGFGFVVDFWNKTGMGRAVGLETAAYGALGREKLQAPIYAAYLDQCRELEGQAFDIVYASEVLEHVQKPLAFLKQLAGRLTPQGLLVLTTPCSDAIVPDLGESLVAAALSPHFHYFVASPKALAQLLAEAGFRQVKIHSTGSRMFAWASQVELPALVPGRMDWPRYFAYLEALSGHADPHVACGALYRLFKDALNTGHLDLAIRAFDRLQEQALRHYGLSFDQPCTQRYLDRRNATGALDTHPAWYGMALLFGGILVGHATGDRRRKWRLLDAAEQILRAEVTRATFRQYAQEAEHFAPYAREQLLVATAECLDAELSARDQSGQLADLARSISLQSSMTSVCKTWSRTPPPS